MNEIGIALEDALNELAENILFDTGEKAKMSIGAYRTSKGEPTPQKEYGFSGAMLFQKPNMLETLRGRYFVRELFPDKKYLLASTTENVYNPRVADITVLECNKVIDLAYEVVERNEFGDDVSVYQKTYSAVSVYSSLVQGKTSDTQVGYIPKTYIHILMPAEYVVIDGNFVIMQEHTKVKDSENEIVYSDVPYLIEDVDSTLVSTKDGETYTGVRKLLITKVI